MGIFQAILDFFRRLLGRSQEPVLSLGSGGRGAAPVPEIDDEDEDDEDRPPEEDATRDGQLSVDDEWADLQVFIARCEAESIDLAGLDLRDPASFWARQQAIERGEAEGKGRLHSVVSAGFRGLEHWEQVSRYYQAKWSQLVKHPDGAREIRPRDEFTQAALRARAR
jgi:hypothetical protein